MLEFSPEIDKICAAFAKAQGAMRGALKDAKNPHFRNEYATLESVVDAVRGPLSENELGFIQATGLIVDGCIPVETRIVHSSGQWFKSVLPMPIGQARTAQAVGSAISYARRYSLMTMLGVPSVDDDGEAATHGGNPQGAAGRDPERRSTPVERETVRNGDRNKRAEQDTLTSSQRFADKILAALASKVDEAGITTMQGSGAFKDYYENLDEPERSHVDEAIAAKRESFRTRRAAA